MERTSAWVIAVGFALAACGGSNVTPGGDGGDVVMGSDVATSSDVVVGTDVVTGSDSSMSPDSAPPPDVVVPPGFLCPTSSPPTGPCPQPGIECSYGTAPDARCRLVVRCASEPTEWFPASSPSCPSGAGAPACPATQPSSMTTCGSSGQLCDYDGSRCACAVCPPGAPVCMTTTPQWYCNAPPNEPCPREMPNLGAACSVPSGQTCDYGECAGNGWAVQCSGGAWVHVHPPCPR